MAEQSRACWGCGAEPAEGAKFQRCMRCAEAKLPSSYFCGEACMLTNWPRHKAWHKEQKTFADERKATSWQQENDRRLAALAARVAEDTTGDEYFQLQANALAHFTADNFDAATKAFRKLIKRFPDRAGSASYHNLGGMLLMSRRLAEAAPLFLQAMERDEEGTKSWAKIAATAFDVLISDKCREVTKPEWWTDEGLKALSARVVALAPGDHNACLMRGVVLSAPFRHSCLHLWSHGPRTAEEIKEAAAWYWRRAALSQGPDLKEDRDKDEGLAKAIDEVADKMLSDAEAEAAPARAAAEAEAKAVREAAESKAAAAAEELLAEEEKEKDQAATKNKAGNAKGKGTKGKGKRS